MDQKTPEKIQKTQIFHNNNYRTLNHSVLKRTSLTLYKKQRGVAFQRIRKSTSLKKE